MKDQLTDLIVQRLNDTKEQLKKDFFFKHPIKVARHFALDDLLPKEIAMQIYADFPKPRHMHLLKISGQLKLKYSHLKDTTTLLQDINGAIQDPRVVAVIEEITEVKNQIPDVSRYAGGITTMLKGGYINPHLDHSHDVDKKYYRTMNMLYYVSPNWSIENGGYYELWDESINHRIVVPNFFNRLVVMETNQTSWHAVSPVLCEAPRCCIYNYFYSEQSPEGVAYFNSASLVKPLFRARPEQKIRRKIAILKQTFFRGLGFR